MQKADISSIYCNVYWNIADWFHLSYMVLDKQGD